MEGIGNLIRRRREELGLTQLQLAHRAGMQRGYISILERSKTAWPKKYSANLARALGISVRDLEVASGRVPALEAWGRLGSVSQSNARLREQSLVALSLIIPCVSAVNAGSFVVFEAPKAHPDDLDDYVHQIFLLRDRVGSRAEITTVGPDVVDVAVLFGYRLYAAACQPASVDRKKLEWFRAEVCELLQRHLALLRVRESVLDARSTLSLPLVTAHEIRRGSVPLRQSSPKRSESQVNQPMSDR